MRDESIAYVYDGSFEGLLTAVFISYKRHEEPYVISLEENLQIVFGQEVVRVETDEALSARVADGIRKKMGAGAYECVWTSFLSFDNDKATKIYRYIRLGMKIGAAVQTHISHEDVMAVDDMCRGIGNESHLLKGFVRFSRMENGVFYAKITPKNSVLPIIMPHFADRFSDQPFIIHDPGHRLAGVYDLKEWYMVEADNITLPALAEDEPEWKSLWRGFYESVTIQERINKKLRMAHLPKRYWPNMTETLI